MKNHLAAPATAVAIIAAALTIAACTPGHADTPEPPAAATSTPAPTLLNEHGEPTQEATPAPTEHTITAATISTVEPVVTEDAPAPADPIEKKEGLVNEDDAPKPGTAPSPTSYAPILVEEWRDYGTIEAYHEAHTPRELRDPGLMQAEPVEGWDTGYMLCGVNAKPAIDQDYYGNWWAYCEPALVD